MNKVAFLLGALTLSACGGAGSSSTTFSDQENCSTVWECINGACECDDGTPCADADTCDVVCEECD